MRIVDGLLTNLGEYDHERKLSTSASSDRVDVRVARSRITIRDLLDEALAGRFARP